MSHFAFHVSDVSHIITWCHTLQTVSATRCHVPPDSHSNLSRLCHICVTLVSHLCNICVTFVSHWLATLSHIGLPCFTSGWSGLSLVVATSLGCLWPFWSFWSNLDPFGRILMTSPTLKWSVLPGEILTSTETNLQRWNLNLSLNLYLSLNSHLHLSLNWNLRGKDVYVEALAFLNDIFTISCFPSFVI